MKTLGGTLRRFFEQAHGGKYISYFEEGVRDRRDGNTVDPPVTLSKEELGKRKSDALSHLFDKAGIPDRFKDASLNDFVDLHRRRVLDYNGKKVAIQACRDLSIHGVSYGKRSLLLMGGHGIGKTTLATTVLIAAVKKGKAALWIQYNDFIQTIQDGYSDGSNVMRERAARECDLLLLDDFGDPNKREESLDRQEIVWRVINHRYVSELPTILTTNLTMQRLAQLFGERTTERLKEMCECITMTGTNLRNDV